MQSEKTLDDIVIKIPGSKDIILPSIKGGMKLSLCLIEVGCKPNSKYMQVKNKERLLKDNFDINSKELFSIWSGIVYFNGVRDYLFNEHSKIQSFNLPDFSLHYKNVSKESLDIKEDIAEQLIRKCPASGRNLFRRSIESKDPEFIEFLLKEGHLSDYCNIRGLFMEYMFRHDLDNACDTNPNLEMKVFPSYYMKLSNEKYKSGTEIDTVMAFYDDRVLRKVLGRLSHQKHIDLRSKDGDYHNLF